jgi:hypothetical protein
MAIESREEMTSEDGSIRNRLLFALSEAISPGNLDILPPRTDRMLLLYLTLARSDQHWTGKMRLL